MRWKTNSSAILLAHTGHPHKKSNSANPTPEKVSETKTNPPTPEVIPDETTMPSPTTILETTPLEAEVEGVTAVESVTPSTPLAVTPFPGLGESIFVLLLAGPFVLKAMKRLSHANF